MASLPGKRIPVSISAGPYAVWVIASDGTIWHTSMKSDKTVWVPAPRLPQTEVPNG